MAGTIRRALLFTHLYSSSSKTSLFRSSAVKAFSVKPAMGDKPVETAVTKKLTEALKPQHLQVINESYMHNVPKGTESHFKVVIVSSEFENISRIKKHQLVHAAIQEELDNSIHALSIVAKTPKEWEASQDIGQSPPCRGGAGL